MTDDLGKAVGTHVGYGRNKGDGSDSQNQQPVDRLNRYADQSDSFFSKSYQAGDLLGQMEEDEAREPLRKSCDEMYSKASPEFNACLNALMEVRPVEMYVSDDFNGGHCCFHPQGRGVVELDSGNVRNNGNCFHSLAAIIQHEYTHAIDANLARVLHLGSAHASDSIPLQSCGGKTLLQCAEEELGNLDGEFFDLIKNYKYEDKEIDGMVEEHKRKLEEISNSLGAHKRQLAETLSKKAGGSVDYYEGLIGNEMSFVEYYDNDMYSLPTELVFAVQSLEPSDLDGLRKDIQDYESWEVRAKWLYKRKNDSSHQRALHLQRTFGDLNDIMSAANLDSNLRGRDCPPIGCGHGWNYFSEDEKRATEIFADIGPCLAHCPEAAEWLKKKAPKLVAGYFELLRLAEESFRNEKR